MSLYRVSKSLSLVHQKFNSTESILKLGFTCGKLVSVRGVKATGFRFDFNYTKKSFASKTKRRNRFLIIGFLMYEGNRIRKLRKILLKVYENVRKCKKVPISLENETPCVCNA